MSRQRLVQTLVGVYGFYDRELTEFAIRIWSDALTGVGIDEVERAFSSHLRDQDGGRWLPKPADILRQLHGDVDDRATLAWSKVLSAACGRQTADFDEQTRAAVDAIGGMGLIRRADESQNGFLQKRFCDAFKALARRETSPPVLEGATPLRIAGS